MRPSQLAGPPSQPSTVAPRRLPPHAPKLLRARARAAARPPPACRRPPGRVDDAAARPDSPCSRSLSPVSPSLSLALGRSTPSPPFAVATDSGHPSLPRVAQKLRHNSLFLPTAPRVPGSPASPPRRRSPLRTPTTVAVKFVVSDASPSPLRRPLQPR